MPSALPSNALENLMAEGFVLLRVETTAKELIAATFETGQTFFRAPAAAKNGNCLPDDCGYRGTGIEYSRSAEHPDPIESFTVSVRTKTKADTLRDARAIELHAQMLSLFQVFECIAERLTIELARRLGMTAADGLAGAFQRWSFLQMNYSRPVHTSAHFINELHEDGHLLTLGCATGPGLEIQIGASTFLPISTGPGEVIIMPGEICYLLSGGRIGPLYHRVRNARTSSERLALLFFGDINPNACKPWVRDKVNEGLNIGARVLTNGTRFGLSKLAPE